MFFEKCNGYFRNKCEIFDNKRLSFCGLGDTFDIWRHQGSGIRPARSGAHCAPPVPRLVCSDARCQLPGARGGIVQIAILVISFTQPLFRRGGSPVPFMGISAPRRMSRPVCAVGALTERPQSPGGRSSPLFCLETHRIFGTALVSEPCWICLRQIAFVPNAGRLTLRVRAAPTAWLLS